MNHFPPFIIVSLEARIANLAIKKNEIADLADNYEAPSLDDYVELKWQEIQRKQREKVQERKDNLKRLTWSVKRQRAKSADPRRIQAMREKETTVNEEGGRIIRGRTFNIEFKTIAAEI